MSLSSLKIMALLGSAALIACGTEPDGPVLNGSWGGFGLAVRASDASARIDDGCSVALILEPLQLNARGETEAAGTLRSVTWQQRFQLRATVSGEHLQVHLTRYHDDGASSVMDYTLTAGAMPDFSGAVCPL
jgi:hypothetical protein